MLKRINPILPELLAGIALYGLVLQLTGMWFVNDKFEYTLSVWMGIALAMGMAVNMAIVILDSVDVMAARGTPARTGFWSMLRYVVVVGVFAGAWYFELGNPLVMFLGVMGLKASAYMQPHLHKFFSRMQKSEGTL